MYTLHHNGTTKQFETVAECVAEVRRMRNMYPCPLAYAVTNEAGEFVTSELMGGYTSEELDAIADEDCLLLDEIAALNEWEH